MTLVLLICLLGTTDDCRDERLTLSVEAMTPMQCLTAAQPAMAAWADGHPKYRIASWRCVPAGSGEVRA